MISNTLLRELRKAIASNRYDVTPDGLWLPGAKSLIQAGGIFETNLNDSGWVIDPNLLPTQGRNALLDIALGSVSKETNWYFAPFATATAPTNSLTAANFAATQTEFTNYDEAARVLWTPGAAANGVISNSATPVSITIGALTGTVNTSIHGLALISASPKGSTNGKLAACTLFATARLGLQDDDILGLRYTITLTSS